MINFYPIHLVFNEATNEKSNAKEYFNEKSNAKEYFNTLETLRDSGVINMFGATSYIQEEFGLNKVDARDVLFAWTHPAS